MHNELELKLEASVAAEAAKANDTMRRALEDLDAKNSVADARKALTEKLEQASIDSRKREIAEGVARAEQDARSSLFYEHIVRLRVLLGDGVGDKGVRDPDSPCASFDPTKPGEAPDAPECQGDGHYLCAQECRHHLVEDTPF